MQCAMSTEHGVLPGKVDVGTQRLGEGVPQLGRVACSTASPLHILCSWESSAHLVLTSILRMACDNFSQLH